MKILFIKLSMVLLLGLVALMPAARASESVDASLNLFKPVSPDEADPGKPISGFILRQRLVTVNFELMPKSVSTKTELHLNLFGDTLVIGVPDETGVDAAGRYAYLGHTPDSAADQIVLVVSDDALSGSIVVRERYYQIRPVGNDRHVVREIDMSRLTVRTERLRSMNSTEIDVVTLVNRERAIEGLHGLAAEDRLTAAAQGHASDMAANDYVSHDSPDGRTAKDRIEAAGYPCFECGENVAGGGIYASPELVMQGWMASQGHRENILRESYCDIGVGYATNPDSSLKHFWTQNFGRQPDVDACPAVEDTGVEEFDRPAGSEGGESASCFIDTR
jgi:hypothetical protein